MFLFVSFFACGTAKRTISEQPRLVKEEVKSIEKDVIKEKEIHMDSSTTQNNKVAVKKDIEVTIPNEVIVDHSLWNELLQNTFRKMEK